MEVIKPVETVAQGGPWAPLSGKSVAPWRTRFLPPPPRWHRPPKAPMLGYISRVRAVAGAIPVIRPLTSRGGRRHGAASGRGIAGHHQLHPLGDDTGAIHASARPTQCALGGG